MKIVCIFGESGWRKGTTNIKVNRKNIFDDLLIQRNVKNLIKYTQNYTVVCTKRSLDI
jgi:hypothetical protein